MQITVTEYSTTVLALFIQLNTVKASDIELTLKIEGAILGQLFCCQRLEDQAVPYL